MVEKKVKNKIVNELEFKVKVVKYDIVQDGNYALYEIKVIGPKDFSFHLQDRYSSLRDFQAMVKRQIVSSDGTPAFPKKKLFGNLERAFL